MKILICSACNEFILPGQQTNSTKGRHRKPIMMHASCWSQKRQGLKTSVHVAMTAYYKSTGAKCVDCGTTEDICSDHKVSRQDGGRSVPENYEPRCRPCNSRKGG
jgi:5-methylcytosine-specific restriction endonuclease McrA